MLRPLLAVMVMATLAGCSPVKHAFAECKREALKANQTSKDGVDLSDCMQDRGFELKDQTCLVAVSPRCFRRSRVR